MLTAFVLLIKGSAANRLQGLNVQNNDGCQQINDQIAVEADRADLIRLLKATTKGGNSIKFFN